MAIVKIDNSFETFKSEFTHQFNQHQHTNIGAHWASYIEYAKLRTIDKQNAILSRLVEALEKQNEKIGQQSQKIEGITDKLILIYSEISDIAKAMK